MGSLHQNVCIKAPGPSPKIFNLTTNEFQLHNQVSFLRRYRASNVKASLVTGKPPSVCAADSETGGICYVFYV